MLSRSTTSGARPSPAGPVPQRPHPTGPRRRLADDAVDLVLARHGLTHAGTPGHPTGADDVDLHTVAGELCAAHDRAVLAGRR